MSLPITPDGVAAKTQGGTVYVKRFFDWTQHVWGGECVTIGEINDGGTGIEITTRADARNGGIRRDGVLSQPPATATSTLSMKRLRGDRLKTILRNCFWLLDKRTQCDAFDDKTRWREIERLYFAKFGPRTTTPGTTMAEASADEMVNFAVTALESVDIYRVNAETDTGIVAAVNTIKCIDLASPERCIGCGDDQTEPMFVAGTEDNGTTSPFILVNAGGGDVDDWTAVPLAEWNGNDVDGITALGSWGGAVSNGQAEVLYSRDDFTTRVNYTTTDLTAHAPNDIDARSLSFVVVVGDDGYIYISRDGLATLETSSAGTVTSNNLIRVQIAPSNSQVVYAISNAADVIVKTENGGETWFQVAATGASGNLQSLRVHPDNEQMVLIGTDSGEIFQTTDGGETWTEQSDIPGLTTKATTVIQDISTKGGGVWFLAANDPGVVERVYINYEDGANGAWEYENSIDGTDYATAEPPIAIAAAGPNRCAIVGGDGSAADMVGLIA